MTSFNIDNHIRREKMRYLLRILRLGRLDRKNAGELKALLMETKQKESSALVKILDSYVSGEIDLMVNPMLLFKM